MSFVFTSYAPPKQVGIGSPTEPIAVVVGVIGSQNVYTGFCNRDGRYRHLRVDPTENPCALMLKIEATLNEYLTDYQQRKHELADSCAYRMAAAHENLLTRGGSISQIGAAGLAFIDKYGPGLAIGAEVLVTGVKHYLDTRLVSMGEIHALRKRLDVRMAGYINDLPSSDLQQKVIQWLEDCFMYGPDFHRRLPQVYKKFDQTQAKVHGLTCIIPTRDHTAVNIPADQ